MGNKDMEANPESGIGKQETGIEDTGFGDSNKNGSSKNGGKYVLC